MKTAIGALVLVAAWCWSSAQAEVKLPAFFSDHMVLQRELPVPVWGTAKPGEKVTVKFRNQEKSVTADGQGKWLVKLDPLTVGGPDKLSVNGVTFEDVLVGEVWVGSGQSNMQMATGSYTKGDEVLAAMVAAAPYPKIRLVRANSKWQEATQQNVNGFSALLFSFGLPLQKQLDVPVGLMVGAVGGTRSSWPLMSHARR
jgi:sialate O-acetylesterase